MDGGELAGGLHTVWGPGVAEALNSASCLTPMLLALSCSKAAAAMYSPMRPSPFLPYIFLSHRIAGSLSALPHNLLNQAVCSG